MKLRFPAICFCTSNDIHHMQVIMPFMQWMNPAMLMLTMAFAACKSSMITNFPEKTFKTENLYRTSANTATICLISMETCTQSHDTLSTNQMSVTLSILIQSHLSSLFYHPMYKSSLRSHFDMPNTQFIGAKTNHFCISTVSVY